MLRQQAAITEELEAAQKRIAELEFKLAKYRRTEFSWRGVPSAFCDMAAGKRLASSNSAAGVYLKRICPIFRQVQKEKINAPLIGFVGSETGGAEHRRTQLQCEGRGPKEGIGLNLPCASSSLTYDIRVTSAHASRMSVSNPGSEQPSSLTRSEDIGSGRGISSGQSDELDGVLFHELRTAMQVSLSLHSFPAFTQIYTNPGSENDLFGTLGDTATDAELLGRGLNPDDLQQVRLMLQGRREGRGGVVEYRLLGAGGKVSWYETRVQPIRNGSRPVCCMLTQTHEITCQKENELALVEQKNRAEAANQAKSDFLANMSHEIRTPLNGILGMLDLLASTNLTKRQQKYLELAITSGENLLDLINDILDFSKIEAGKFEAHEHNFLLLETVETAISMFAKQADEKCVSLGCRIEPSVPVALLGDDAKLRQILLNLLGNAMKFTPAGSIMIEVCRLPDPASGDIRLLFTVTDTGIGIADDKVDFVFEEFAQVGDSHTRRYAGTGLGLGIVKRLVAMLGGTIALESRSGIGTTIYFTIRMSLAESNSAKFKRPVAVQSESDRPLTILLAEDDRINRLIGGSLLENMGHKVIFAENGKEVIRILEEREDIDCILMDIQMPEMDGVEASRVIRHSHRHKSSVRIPIIALTAHALNGDREKFMAAGMDEYITKPYRAEELQSVLAQVQVLKER